MKKVVLIHAHKNLDQLNDLIEILSSDNHSIYVNLDKKSNLDPGHINLKARLIKKRISVEWGRFSQVKATLNALEEISILEKDFEHLIFISGQDFPLASNNRIDEVLIPGKEFIDYKVSSKEDWDFVGRYEKFHFGHTPFLKELSSIFYRRIMKPLHWKRRFPYGLTPYAGSNWWILTRECIDCILEFIKNHKRYSPFFQLTNCPDEIFFQSIVINSSFKNDVVNSSLRYVDWSESKIKKTSSPKILLTEDFDKIMASGNLFCRKIEYPQSRELVDKIKKSIENQQDDK